MEFTFIKKVSVILNRITSIREKSNTLKNSITIRTLLSLIVCVSHQLYIFFDFHSFILDTRLAVACFFFISGFSIAHSLSRRSIDLAGLKDFYKARFKRVYIPYLVLIVIQTALFSWVFKSQFIEAAKYFYYNIFLLNFKYPFPGIAFNYPVNGSLWSLKWEVLCYILAPLFFYLFLKSETKKLLIVLIFAGILYSSFIDYSYANNPLFLIFIFVVGLRLYFFNSIVLTWVIKNPSFVLVSIALYIFLSLSQILLGVFFGIIVIYYFLNHFELDKFIKIDISYSIYIIHFPIAVLMRNLLIKESFQDIIIFILMTLITVGISFFYTILVEKKFTQFLFKIDK